MSDYGKVLYVGGFELPDRNAAAQRVSGIAKSLREVGYDILFVNALKEYSGEPKITEYFGFQTYEYKREGERDYLFGAHKVISIIEEKKPIAVIAYNYPAIALNKISKYCRKSGIRCVADVTEWPKPIGGSLLYRIIKELDTTYRMRYVQKHVDSVIAISRFLYDYYRPHVQTVLIPPTVDISDSKWRTKVEKKETVTSFVYAGSPSALKEKLDVVIEAIEVCAKTNRIEFNVVGITREQYKEMYSWQKKIPNEVIFWGRVSHSDVIRIVREATWSIILRDNNIVVKAGFPTKLVESISCGTPVLVNKFSNITDYLDDENSIVVENDEELKMALEEACYKKLQPDTTEFDYHNYLKELKMLFI